MTLPSLAQDTSLATPPQIDLKQFMGDWYVIATIPTGIERDAYSSRENFRIRDDAFIEEIFECHLRSFSGPTALIRRKGWVTNHTTNSEWRLKSFWFFSRSFQILELGDHYEYCVISRGSNHHVSILSRQRFLEEPTMEGILHRLSQRGFDISKIEQVPQPYFKHAHRRVS